MPRLCAVARHPACFASAPKLCMKPAGRPRSSTINSEAKDRFFLSSINDNRSSSRIRLGSFFTSLTRISPASILKNPSPTIIIAIRANEKYSNAADVSVLFYWTSPKNDAAVAAVDFAIAVPFAYRMPISITIDPIHVQVALPVTHVSSASNLPQPLRSFLVKPSCRLDLATCISILRLNPFAYVHNIDPISVPVALPLAYLNHTAICAPTAIRSIPFAF
ncbi:hypothetical protein PGTUg99_002772 [Puccinia graminis f. sp. tritici]|uniref:Uncharacterized protein n=1 Tax=Puccinia graminis f. sp. tritici TaxID=56615 RepID=A0A5B0SB05_PUCGR|nr:hypothetical protein PGTUg99_002772 [Puccinia graminis f. sp. tritici]